MLRPAVRRALSPISNAYRTVVTFLPSSAASFQRPTPVVIVGGEGCDVKMWRPFIECVAVGGYGGAFIPYVSHNSSFYDAADTVQAHITQLKLTPPVLVAHSMSTYMIQKYLESYALSGLVLVNPIPPFTAPAVTANLQHRWQESHTEASTPSASITRYYGIAEGTDCISNSAIVTSETSPEQPFLARSAAVQTFLTAPDNADAKVNLERGSVPTLVITSDGDNSLLQDTDLQDLLDLHAASGEDSLVHFGAQDPTGDTAKMHGNRARAPMITHSAEFNSVVYDWIESVA